MSSESDDHVGDRVKDSTRSGRKISKAAREKLKRDHMNELFSNLENTLGLDHPNNGKASILRESIRLLGELITQVDSLRKENTTLLSESNYVTVERDELFEETSALNAQIKSLQREIDERADCPNSDISQLQTNATTELPIDLVPFPLVGHAPETASVVGPVFVLPLHHESQGFFPEVSVPEVPSSVKRPLPRYPSSYDSWPSHILAKD